MASAYFESYVANINRIRIVELVEHYNLELRARDFRASLVANPITGLPYESIHHDESNADSSN